MIYDWDESKNRENIKKHTLNFEDAYIVLEQTHLLLENKRKSYGETRMIAIGYLAGRIVVMVYTKRGDCYRIISMRKANEREQKKYKDRLEAIR